MKIRDTLEAMVSNLKSTNEHMEGKIAVSDLRIVAKFFIYGYDSGEYFREPIPF